MVRWIVSARFVPAVPCEAGVWSPGVGDYPSLNFLWTRLREKCTLGAKSPFSCRSLMYGLNMLRKILEGAYKSRSASAAKAPTRLQLIYVRPEGSSPSKYIGFFNSLFSPYPSLRGWHRSLFSPYPSIQDWRLRTCIELKSGPVQRFAVYRWRMDQRQLCRAQGCVRTAAGRELSV